MSNGNTATQAATTATATETSEAVVQPVQETTAPAAATAKRQKMTDRIVATLRGLEENQLLTIAELSAKMSDVKRETLQATLSQLVKAKRVEKVTTGKRQPGYKATK